LLVLPESNSNESDSDEDFILEVNEDENFSDEEEILSKKPSQNNHKQRSAASLNEKLKDKLVNKQNRTSSLTRSEMSNFNRIEEFLNNQHYLAK